MQLSKRLSAIAEMITPGNRLVDVGTDHAYLPVYCVTQQIVPSALAMDINCGPLERAAENIRVSGLSAYIETRLSDGVQAMAAGEADSLVIAGMGGGLVSRILEQGRDRLEAVQELILQPQSDIFMVRKYLRDTGYRIVKEDMVEEEGKFYTMMKAVKRNVDERQPVFDPEGKLLTDEHDPEGKALTEEQYSVYDQYGQCLAEERHPVLLRYLTKQQQVYEQILAKISGNESEQAKRRARELREELCRISWLLERHYEAGRTDVYI